MSSEWFGLSEFAVVVWWRRAVLPLAVLGGVLFCLTPSSAALEPTADASTQLSAPKRQDRGVPQSFVPEDFMGLRLQNSRKHPRVPPWDRRNWPPGWVLETPRGPGIADCCFGLPETKKSDLVPEKRTP